MGFKKAVRFFKKTAPSIELQPSDSVDNTLLCPWWGTFQILEGETRFWHLKDLTLCLERHPKGWHLGHRMDVNNQNPFHFETLVTDSASREVMLFPALPDRFLIFSLVSPLCILPNEEIILHIATPLCVQIRFSSLSTLFTLSEKSLEPLFSTWQGSPVQEGQLCYAVSLPPIDFATPPPPNNFHAVIPITIKNRGKEPFWVRSLQIPTPYLSLYTDAQHTLWTEPLHLDQNNQEIGRESEVMIAKGVALPTQVQIDLLTPPRQSLDTGFRKIGSWLSTLQK